MRALSEKFSTSGLNAVFSQLTAVPRAWRRPLFLMFSAVVALLWLYKDTALGMVEIWYRSETNTHPFLVPPIAIWLIWRQRQQLVFLTPRPMPWMLVPMFALGMMWLLGEMVSANAVRQFALVAVIVICVPLVGGWDLARAIGFPLAYLFFCVPVGEALLPTLMDWTADFTVAALRLSGVPVFREGMNFTIPSGNWSVVEACSGVRYLIASLMVGTLFAYLNYRSARRRLLFVGVSILVPIVANWVRAYMIVMLGHLSNNKIATGVDHLIYGWVFFGVVITIMFMIGARWAEPDLPQRVASQLELPEAGLADWRMTLVTVVGVVLLAFPPIFANSNTSVLLPVNVTIAVPKMLPGGWRADAESTPIWAPRFDNPSATAHALYRKAGSNSVVGVHIYYYRGQSQERKLITSTNQLIRRSVDHGWVPLQPVEQFVRVGQDQVEWRRTQLLMPPQSATSRGSLSVWQTFWSGNQLTSNEFMAALVGSWHRLLGRGDDTAAIFLYTVGAPDDGADKLLAAFASEHTSQLVEGLRRPQLSE